MDGILRAFRAVLEARTIAFRVLLLPVSDRDRSLNDAVLSRLCATEALQCTDMAERFLKGDQLPYSPSNGHLSAVGVEW
jgi:hypothetical protein